MSHKTLNRLMAGLAIMSLLLVACGTAAPTPIPTQIPATPTSAPAATATPTLAPTESVTVWDYLAFGDSRTGMGQWPRMFADYMEDDLGIEVKLHHMAIGGQDSDMLLADLREDDKLRALVREAEVVTVWTGGIRAKAAYESKGVSCDRLLEAMDRDLGAIVAEILALREGKDTIIRLLEDYHFNVERQKDLGFFEDKKACFEAVNAITHQVADEYGVLVAPLYLAFNGPDGEDDPEAYLEDYVHTNAAGDAIIADLLRELGYDFAPP
jgi:hypothetical protein